MARPATLTCIECRAFSVERGYDGYYPGSHACMDIGCAKQVWRLDNEDSQETFETYLRTALNCDQYEGKVNATTPETVSP